MTDSSAFGFGKFIPGFDFLQNLGKSGATPSGLPPFSHWVAPTVSVEEIDKRIEELKAVHFWLEQNSKALAATVQALEVQKMTLSTLKGMNVNLSEMAKAFPFAAAATAPAKNPLTDWPMSAAAQPAEAVAQPPQPQPQQAPETPKAQAAASPSAETAEGPSDAAQTANMATAMQWWGALTQQFQHIAQQAMQDPAQQQAMLKATQMSTDFAKTAVKTASDLVRQAVAQAKPQKSAAAPASKAAATARQSAPAQKKPVASPPAATKKAASAAKKAPAAAAKTQRVAAKKPTVRKPRTA